MITATRFFGNAYELSVAADFSFNRARARMWVVTVTAAGVKGKLPDARQTRLGGPVFEIVNLGPQNLEIIGFNSTSLITLTPNQWATAVLSSNTTQLGTWHFHVGTAGSIADPPLATLIYSIGGYSTSVATQAIQTFEFNPQVRSWTAKTSTAIQRYNAMGFVIGAKGYICGTQNATSTNAQSNVEYDPDVFTAKNLMGDECYFGAACTLSGKGYRFGGTKPGGGANTRRIYEYTSGTDAWAAKTQSLASQGDQGHGFVCLGAANTGYSFGTTDPAPDNATNLYNATSDTWTSKTTRPGPGVAGFASQVLGGLGFVFGGATPSTSDVDLKDTYEYTSGTDSWIKRTDYPLNGRRDWNSGVLAGKAYLFGGTESTTPGNTVDKLDCYEYDASTHTWTSKLSLPANRTHFQNHGMPIQI